MNGLALCAGYGGLELGIESFFDGYRTVCYVEGGLYPAAEIIKKMEKGWMDEAPIWSNVRTFDGSIWRGKVDIISGGFPCQPYSTAGKQLATADPRDLWPDVARIVGEVLPEYIFFENVPGIVKWRLDSIILELYQIGYDCSWCVLGAVDAGAPHRRNRWFLFGVRNGADPNHSRKCPIEGPVLPDNGKNVGRSCHDVSHADDQGLWGCSGGANIESVESCERRFNDVNGGSTNAQPWGYSQPSDIQEDVPNPDGGGRKAFKSKAWRRKFNFEGGRFTIPDTISERIQGTWNFNGKKCQIRKGKGDFDENDKWGGRFETWWEVEPSVGRLAHGCPHWVDKLRLLGNGVVPQQAHLALKILTKNLGLRRIENES